MNIFYFFIQSIPESIGIIALCLAYGRVPLRWGRIVTGAVILSVTSYIIRSLPLTFGFHLPVMILVMFLLVTKWTMLKSSHAVVVIFGSFFTLILLEYVVSNVYFAITEMNLNEAMAHQATWAALGIFQAVILNGIALLVSHIFRPVRELWKT